MGYLPPGYRQLPPGYRQKEDSDHYGRAENWYWQQWYQTIGQYRDRPKTEREKAEKRRRDEKRLQATRKFYTTWKKGRKP